MDSSEFGFSVLIRKNLCNHFIAAIGSPGFENDSGKVYIVRSVDDDQDWVFDSFITSEKYNQPKIGDRFGQVISFYETTLIVSAPGLDSKRGAVFIFQEGEGCKFFFTSSSNIWP